MSTKVNSEVSAEELARNVVEHYGGRWRGTKGSCRCPAHSGSRDNLSVAIGREGRPVWRCHAGCTQAQVQAALQADGLISGRIVPVDEVRLAELRKEEEKDAIIKADQAQSSWNESRDIGGTLAESYLRSRGITCPLPPTLCFHPRLWHFGAKTALPAMVSAIAGVPGSDGVVRSAHWTFLDPRGGKAKVDPDKMMRGKALGGAVRVTNAGPDSWLVVAEGIETALSLACGLLPTKATIWAALNTSGMKGLVLPEGRAKKLVVAADFDPIDLKTGKRPGTAAAEQLAHRAREAGWEVRILYPKDGLGDFNDELMQKNRSAAVKVADSHKGIKEGGNHEYEGNTK
jgi:hypothetical protein